MSAKRDKGVPPEVKPRQQLQVVTQEREYKLITPLFGGGAIKGERDAITVVRGTEIRGQLRFWWRACYGGRYDDVEKMKKAEDQIWGAAATSKKDGKGKESVEEKKEEDKKPEITVQIIVEALNEKNIEPKPPYKLEGETGNRKVRSNYNIPSYAAFPFRPPQEKVNDLVPPVIKPVFDNIRFRLTILFPLEWQKEIEGVLWAWETFGGLGARTRRGFGALQLTKIKGKDTIDLPTSSNVDQWIREHIAALQTTSEPPVKGKAPENVPSLTSGMPLYVMQGPFRNANEAWNKSIQQLAEFRQSPHGREKRSKWPEAEAIRTLTKKRYFKYTALSHPQKFPRAAFGLPIIFHFKDENKRDPQKGDPLESTLQGTKEGHDRLASPLILRPLICKDSHAVGLAVVLTNVILPDELLLKEDGGESYSVNPHLNRQESAKVEPLAGQTDVLQAFINYLGGNKK